MTTLDLPPRPTVWIPSLPSRYDAETKEWKAIVNVQAAARYGNLKVMFKPGNYSHAIHPMCLAMREQLRAFEPADFLVAIGDPSLMSAAAGMIGRRSSCPLNLLVWDRHVKDYVHVEIPL